MSLYYQDETITLLHGDSLEQARTLPSGSVDCIVTSPPYYGLRNYGSPYQYGMEETPALYVETLRKLFTECRRALADDGTFWLNLGDSYGKSKNLLGMPWRVALALQGDGWILRNSIIWHKPNAMPESVTDRLSGRHENLFMFTKSQRYWFDLDSIREDFTPQQGMANSFARNTKEADVPGQGYKQHRSDRKASDITPRPAGVGAETNRGPSGKRHDALNSKGKNPGDIWSIPTQPFGGAHFAVFPQELARRAIVAGCRPGGTVLDPFSGSGTTGLVAQQNGRRYVGIDISADYLKLSLETRLQNAVLDFGGAA